MTHDRTPPPQTRTPAELAGRHLIAYYENRATDLGEGEALEATFIAPSGTELTAVALFPLTDTILGIDALDAAGTRHLCSCPAHPSSSRT